MASLLQIGCGTTGTVGRTGPAARHPAENGGANARGTRGDDGLAVEEKATGGWRGFLRGEGSVWEVRRIPFVRVGGEDRQIGWKFSARGVGLSCTYI